MIVNVQYRLRESIQRADFEQWVQESDVPLMRSLTGVEFFSVAEVAGGSEYIESIRLTSEEDWDRISDPDAYVDHKAQFDQFVEPDSVQIVRGHELVD